MDSLTFSHYASSLPAEAMTIKSRLELGVEKRMVEAQINRLRWKNHAMSG